MQQLLFHKLREFVIWQIFIKLTYESGCELVPQMKGSSSSKEDEAHNSHFLKSVFHSAQQFLFIPINEGKKDCD